MSYNKLKSLVANVEAIETAMKIQVQGRQATAEEKEILSRYSGFGGIKEVLNIGTDKPISGDMQEPIQRLQELINAYPHFTEPMRHNVIEGIKASVLTAVINETTKRTAETRDIMNLNLIAFYDNLFKPAKINIKAIMANLIGGIYYLILHRRCAKTCTIDFSTQEGEKVFFEWIDYLTDTIFDKLEAYERNRKAAQEMLSDGISEFKICKYMGINKNDLRILLSK